MVNLSGTNIASGIVPFTSDDNFPTHYSQYGKGGWRETSTISERDSIPEARRVVGMSVYVVATDKLYILKGGITNDKWVEFTTSSESPYKPFVYEQAIPNNRWEINHKLGYYPNVSIVDSAGTIVEGDVQYIDKNNIVVEFSAPFTGKAYLS